MIAVTIKNKKKRLVIRTKAISGTGEYRKKNWEYSNVFNVFKITKK